jgi:hypothetical protein
MLWNDDSGEISEYALILALILMLGVALISQTGTNIETPLSEGLVPAVNLRYYVLKKK